MLVLCKNKVVDLNKFDAVEISSGLISDDYAVDAIKGNSNKGAFRVELVRFKNEDDAVELLNELSVCWVHKHDYFDMRAYFEDIPCSGFRDMLGE